MTRALRPAALFFFLLLVSGFVRAQPQEEAILLVALVRAENAPGAGSVLLMKNLYLAFRANTIDHVIETTPNEARYFVGYVGWRPGELRSEIDRGLWSVMNAEVDTIFRKETEGLWEELLQATKRIRAEAPSSLAAAR